MDSLKFFKITVWVVYYYKIKKKKKGFLDYWRIPKSYTLTKSVTFDGNII